MEHGHEGWFPGVDFVPSLGFRAFNERALGHDCMALQRGVARATFRRRDAGVTGRAPRLAVWRSVFECSKGTDQVRLEARRELRQLLRADSENAIVGMFCIIRTLSGSVPSYDWPIESSSLEAAFECRCS